MLNDLLIDHPYYCSESNYYSNDASTRWETMTEFLDAYEDADIDMNMVFRWDVKPRGEGENSAGRYYAEIFMMHQRKGIFSPHYIAHINDSEAERLKIYLTRHWQYMKDLWEPLSNV